MNAQGIPDFQAPPPIPTFIDTQEAIDELPLYDSFEPSVARGFLNSAFSLTDRGRVSKLLFFSIWPAKF
jgi:hypothetical protein